MPNICHIITGLNTGGAEIMLRKLLEAMGGGAFEARVISLTTRGAVGELIEKMGIPVIGMGLRGGVPDPVKVFKTAWELKKMKADIVQTWMYHADLFGGLAAKALGNVPVVWNIRHGEIRKGRVKRRTFIVARICAKLSGVLPRRIICNSEDAKRNHAAMGYRLEQMKVIPNGFDLERYRKDPAAGLAVRRELKIEERAILIGLVGRYAPIKDHMNFVEAAGILKEQRDDVHFVLCGEGISPDNQELTRAIQNTGVAKWFHLMGRRDDMERITGAFDIATNASAGESFSNAIGEAMACEVPCVVTDVGDSALIVGESGRVIPPRSPQALAQGWVDLIRMGAEGRRRLGALARQRIARRYSIQAVAEQYADLYEEVLEG